VQACVAGCFPLVLFGSWRQTNYSRYIRAFQSPGKLTVAVKDRQGNWSRIERTFDPRR
jgi:hypothetical protein